MSYDALFYAQPFVLSIVISVALCLLVYFLHKKNFLAFSRTERHHTHKKHISRFGGIAMILAFIFSLYINQALVFDKVVWAIVIGSVGIMIFGIIDDIRPISWKSQLFFQVALVLITFICGVRVEYISDPFGGVWWLIVDQFPFLSILFMLVWMMLIMNAINWSDGIDGLSGGVVFIAAISIFIIALKPHVMQPPIAIVATVLSGSVLGFLLLNFPPARIFAGSSGAFFMGYVIAVLAIAAGAKIGTTLLVLIVPLIDLAWVIIQRIRIGKSIFHADTQHFHHRLLKNGWSVKQILFLYYGVTIFSSIAAIVTQSISKFIVFILLCIGVFLFFSFTKYEKKEISI
jgi:UDP-GlcNAc:undecaprenyl-phosphate/decaprenyl-phosphate GlcNAc-1-phosphate transferase